MELITLGYQSVKEANPLHQEDRALDVRPTEPDGAAPPRRRANSSAAM
jgi:hypothetical protein